MKQATAWTFKNVCLPLMPFLAGAFIRCSYQGKFLFVCISPSELSFAMAMLSLLMIVNASKIRDKDLKDMIAHGYQVGVFVFFLLFACSVFIEIDTFFTLESISKFVPIQNCPDCINKINYMTEHIERYSSILSIFRRGAICCSVFIVPLTVIISVKYDLKDSE